jgi:hypothetical protein
MRRKEIPLDGLLRFEAAMRAVGDPARPFWIKEGPASGVLGHATYSFDSVNGPAVYVEALPGDRWRAFVRTDAPEALRAAVARAQTTQ